MEITVDWGKTYNEELRLTVWFGEGTAQSNVIHSESNDFYDVVTYSSYLEDAINNERLVYKFGKGEKHYDLSEEQVTYLKALKKALEDKLFSKTLTLEV